MVENNQDEIRVVNYLDMNSDVVNGQIKEFSIEKLQKVFPDIDENVLMEIESEWRKARNVMINLKF